VGAGNPVGVIVIGLRLDPGAPLAAEHGHRFVTSRRVPIACVVRRDLYSRARV
jgi:hypothetical protein